MRPHQDTARDQLKHRRTGESSSGRYARLKIEREAIKREKDQGTLKALNEEIANLREERNQLKAKWQAEKDLVEQIQARKSEIEQLKFEDEVRPQ